MGYVQPSDHAVQIAKTKCMVGGKGAMRLSEEDYSVLGHRRPTNLCALVLLQL